MANPSVTDLPGLYDDFENGDTCIRFVSGRRGFWFSFGDSGWTTPIVETDTERSSHVLLATGTTTPSFPWWGVATWPNATSYCDEQPVDLSQYSGISFWAKNTSGAAVKITVRDDATQLNTSNEGATSPTFLSSIGANWAQHKVYWADLKRPLDQVAAMPQSIHIIKWEAADDNASYALSLDDVTFFKD